MDLKYLIKRITSMDFSNMKNTVNDIYRRTHKNRFLLYCDIFWCGLRYTAGYADYALFCFYRLNHKQRASYLTRGKNNQAVRYFNNPDFVHVFEDKVQFHEKFVPFIHRDYLDLKKCSEQDFEHFIQSRDAIIAKPADGICGKGVIRASVCDYRSIHEMYDYLKESNRTLIEEIVQQHDDIAAIYNHSLNTLRIVTLLREDDVVEVLFASMRIGNHGSFVDNINSGGMSALIDPKTGIITKAGEDKNLLTYSIHPQTGKDIVGFQVPRFEEAIELCKKAATVIPQVRYIAWDVAVTNDGVQLIEANTFPGHDIMQLSSQRENGMGILPVFQRYMIFK